HVGFSLFFFFFFFQAEDGIRDFHVTGVQTCALPILTAWVLLVLAFLFPSAGPGVRVAALVLGSVQILLALGGAAQGTPFGILPLAGAVAVVVLLGQGSAGGWFRRPRTR